MNRNSTPLSTVRQIVPRLASVLRNLRPTYWVEDVSALDADFLGRHRIDAVIWDVDGTLMAYHGLEIAPVFREQVRDLFRHGPARHAILSNCDEARFRVLGGIFPEVPVIRGYQTPHGSMFRTLLDGRDTHDDDEIRELLEHGRQIRKPSAQLIRFTQDRLGVSDPTRILMVGDQYFTDIASANLAGIKSAKVRNVERASFPATLRGTQILEGVVYRLLHGSPSHAGPG